MCRPALQRILILLILLLGLVYLSGCGGTAASMRIEVEVYKGPLSKTREVQWGEFVGLVDEAMESFTTFGDALMLTAANLSYVASTVKGNSGSELKYDPHFRSKKLAANPGKNPESMGILPRARKPQVVTRTIVSVGGVKLSGLNDSKVVWCEESHVKASRDDLIPTEIMGCSFIVGIHDEVRVLLAEIYALRRMIEDRNKIDLSRITVDSERASYYRRVAEKAAQVAVKMKAKALYWAEAHVSTAPRSRPVRIAIANFSNLASEYSNQFASRADALTLQFADGQDREKMALSKYLRDAETTDFLNLYTWNRAAAPALVPDMILHPVDALSSDETADRVRVIERLFADHNWSHVNTVYASGKGEVAMALIKDDIGNWNLKSFDSDPTELVNAYKQITLAGLDAAAKAARTSATGGGSQFLNVASRLTRGRLGEEAELGGSDPTQLHERAATQLEALEKEAGRNERELEQKLGDAKKKVIDLKSKAADSEAKAKEMDERENPADGALTGSPKVSEVDDHLEITTKKANTARIAAIGAKLTVDNMKGVEVAAKASTKTVEHADKSIEFARVAETSATTARSALDTSTSATGENGGETDPVANQNGVSAANRAQLNAEKALAFAVAAQDYATLAKAESDQESTEEEKQAYREDIVRQIRDILNDHSAVISVLEEATAPPVSSSNRGTPLRRLPTDNGR